MLITCPHRWGKTVNMEMLKTFLEIEMDIEDLGMMQKQKTNQNYFNAIN